VPLRDQVRATCERFGAHRVALVMGSSTGGILASEEAYAHFCRKGEIQEGYSYGESHALHATPFGLARALGVQGPTYVISTACSSSSKALASARRLIEVGVCDAVLCGGVDSLCALTVMGFHSLGVLRASPCTPFGGPPYGMNVAEGAAWLLLERGRGPVYLVGSGESSDAFSLANPDPSGTGPRLAIEQALGAAGLRARERGVLAERARAILMTAYERRALVRVPAPVLAEVCRGPRFDSAVNHVLNNKGIAVFDLNRDIAQRAGRLLAKAKLASEHVVDAFVVSTALAFDSAVIATVGPKAIKRLLGSNRTVRVFAL
jgi:hypothetical protein